MKEIKAIISAYDDIDRRTTRAALCTVVRVEGSSYRREGARMLVLDDGHWIGGISGGCLEGDALNRARYCISKAFPSIVTYDTTEDDGHQIGAGLGCNGIIDVLFVPLDFENNANPVEVLRSCISPRQNHVLLTISRGSAIEISTGESICYCGSESLERLHNETLQHNIEVAIDEQRRNGKSAMRQFLLSDDIRISIFIELLPPEIHLIIAGDQYDALPMATVAKSLGWRVTLVSDRIKYGALAELVDSIVRKDAFSEIVVDPYSAIVLMSHDYNTDLRNLGHCLRAGAGYIGMLGPRVRAEKIFGEICQVRDHNIDECHDLVNSPAGLDIGARSPEEIALSVCGEICAELSGRSGGSLKLRSTTIHERT